MAARTTGFAMLASSSVQEAQDLALVAHAATLESRVPFLHFFDGFRHLARGRQDRGAPRRGPARDDRRPARRTSTGHARSRRSIRACAGPRRTRTSSSRPARPANPWYAAVPDLVQGAMDRLAARTGRPYRLFDYVGHPEAERVLILMGSGVGAAEEAVDAMIERGDRVGLVKVRLFRPFSAEALVAALPESVRGDRGARPHEGARGAGRTAVPGRGHVAGRETSAGRARFAGGLPRVLGGRYGLSSKEFTPAMAKAALDELAALEPVNHFTVGITDDVTHLSLPVDPDFDTEDPRRRARRLLRAGERRHRQREQEHDQDHRRGHGPPRAGVLRLRLEEGRRG